MIVFLMLSFLCIFGEKIEKILHDKYIILEPIPFPGMNYRLCYWVVVVSCFAYFNRHIQKKENCTQDKCIDSYYSVFVNHFEKIYVLF